MNRFALALALASFTGCLDADVEDEEALGTEVSALCTDGAADATVAFKDKQGFSGATSSGPSSSYDRAACADHYSVEITGTGSATQAFSVSAGWGEPLPNTAEACPMALATVQTQEYRQSFNCSGGFCFPVWNWVDVGSEVTLHGVWSSGTFGGCSLVPESPLPTLQPSLLRSKVRVSVRAFAWAVFFPAYKKATGGVYSNYIIN